MNKPCKLLAQPTAWHLLATHPSSVASLLGCNLAPQALSCEVSSPPRPVAPSAPPPNNNSNSPQQLHPAMALPSVLSPSKQMLCSPSRQPFSPCNLNVRPAASPSPCSAKRSLAVLHQSFTTSAAVGHGSGAHGSSSSSPAHKRQEPDGPQAASLAGPAASGNPPGPLTPAVALPLISSLLPSAGGLPYHQQQHPRQASVVAHATPRGSGLRSRQSLAAQQQHMSSASTPSATAVDTIAAADQVPSPLAILEFPPELEQVLLPGQQPAAAEGGQGLDVQLDVQPHHSHGQQQPGACHRPAMSGRRVTARYDIPLGFDWLSGVPDHAPGLGEGRLEVIMGPMFAGKTTRLINRVKEVSDQDGKLAVAVKSSKDERYGCHWVVTHDGRCMRCYTAETLADFKAIMGPAYHKLQVLAIDEAQFFPDLLEFCRSAVDVDGKHVIVAGLSGDFRRQRFGELLELMPLADSITQLTSKCAFCECDALFSLRVVGAAGPQALVGGDDKYRATCRRCYLTHSGTMQ